MTFQLGDRVRTKDGEGRIQWHNDDGTYRVWITKSTWTGKSDIPSGWNSSSPTISMNYTSEEMIKV